jgi:hypothetical protein
MPTRVTGEVNARKQISINIGRYKTICLEEMERVPLPKVAVGQAGWVVIDPVPVPVATVSAPLAGGRFPTSRVPRAVICPAPGVVLK